MLFDQVKEFHTTFDILVNDKPTLPQQGTRDLRIALLVEEVEEFYKADADNDLVEIADSLADIAYVIAGTCLSYGIVPTQHYFQFADLSTSTSLPIEAHRVWLNEDFAECLTAYQQAEADNDLDDIKQTLLSLLINVDVTAYAYGIPLSAIINEVHRSNMSKLPEDGIPLRNESGKIMKPITYSRPSIELLLNV